jgi:site-specific DNA recombinase
LSPYFFCIGRTRRNGCDQPYVPVHLIEKAVEHTYATVRPPREHIQEVRSKLDRALAGMRQHAEQDVKRQQRRMAKLADERTKLLHAYYQGAIPLDLLHQEQERISTQSANAEAQLQIAQRSASDVQVTLQKALDLLAACPGAYARAPGHLRRQWNQALFLRLLVHDEDIQAAEIAEPFATLATPGLADELDRHQQGPRQAQGPKQHDGTAAINGGGSNKGRIVGEAGFEPAAAPSTPRGSGCAPVARQLRQDSSGVERIPAE